jgi:hypothetical protein
VVKKGGTDATRQKLQRIGEVTESGRPLLQE